MVKKISLENCFSLIENDDELQEKSKLKNIVNNAFHEETILLKEEVIHRLKSKYNATIKESQQIKSLIRAVRKCGDKDVK